MAGKILLKVTPGITHEPNCVNVSFESETYKLEMMRALNWYSMEREKKDAYKYLREWIKVEHKEMLPAFDKIRDTKIFPTWGWLARIASRGAQLAPHDTDRLHQYVKSLVATSTEVAPVVVATTTTPRPSVLDLLRIKIDEYLAETIETEIDQFFLNGMKSTFSAYADLKHKQLSPHYAKAVMEMIKPKLAEIENIENDDQLKEGYEFLGKRGQTAFISFLNGMIADAERYGAFKKADRKPRVKKAQPAAIQVAKLKYQSEAVELGIKSIHPTEIIGAQQVWVLNTKTRKLQVYQATGSDGFGVRGTSILGYDTEVSIQKTVRKPAEAIKQVQEAGKIQLRRILDSIASKAAICNGRMTETSLIIRVLK